MEVLGFFPQFRAMILGILPNIVQSIIAAFGDYYTWQLAQSIYGRGNNATLATVRDLSTILDSKLTIIQLLMTLFSPWQWFCSTRTFSNCLETTLTITALYFWPWEMTVDSVLPKASMKGGSTPAKNSAVPSIFGTPQALTR